MREPKGIVFELADCARYGVPAITVFGLTRGGEALYWRQVGDTCGRICPETLRKSYELTWELIQAVDRLAGEA